MSAEFDFDSSERGVSPGRAIGGALATAPREMGVVTNLVERIEALGPADAKFTGAYFGVWDLPAAVMRAYVRASDHNDIERHRLECAEGHARATALVERLDFRAIEKDYRELSACPKCGEPRGYSVFLGRMLFEECVPCAELARRKELRAWRQQVRASWGAIYAKRIGRRHWGKSIKIHPTVRALALGSPGRCAAYLHGPAGTGKTQQAALLVGAILDRACASITYDAMVLMKGRTPQRLPAPPEVLFVTEQQLLEALRPGGEGRSEDFTEPEWLILDDMGVCKGSAWALQSIQGILNSRYNAMSPTLITSNLTLEELQSRSFYDDRTTGRLLEMCGSLDPDTGEPWVVEMTTNWRLGGRGAAR